MQIAVAILRYVVINMFICIGYFSPLKLDMVFSILENLETKFNIKTLAILFNLGRTPLQEDDYMGY